MNIGDSSRQFIEKVRQLEQGEGFNFEDLLDAVAERNAAMDAIPGNKQELAELPFIRIASQEDMIDFVETIKNGPVVAVGIGDVLCLAIRTTNQARKFICLELVQLLDQWFTQIEASELVDGDLLPKLVLDECRIALQ